MITTTKTAILLVEDDPITAKLQMRQLEQAGFGVVWAKNGESALELMADPATQPQLVLMDIDLGPGIDGTETARRILHGHEVPILFLSSHVEDDFVARTEAIASYGYLVKGCAFSITLASIRMALRLHAAKAQVSQLLAQEQQFKRLFDALPDLVSIQDDEFTILYSNGQGFAATKTGPITGRKCYQAYRNRDSECGDCPRRLLAGSSGPVSAELEIDGRWLEFRIMPLPAVPGQKPRFMEWVRDISEHRSMQARIQLQKAMYEAVLESTDMAIFSLDRSCHYLSFNTAHARAMQAMYGAAIELGHNFYEYQTVPEDVAKSRPNIERCLNGEQFTECAYSGAQGHSRAYVEVSHNPIRDAKGQIAGASFFMRDVTERKLAEDRITELLKEKQLLLRETHHRVRNNLSMVHSMLAVRAAAAASAQEKQALEEAAASIQSMLVLYSRLHGSPDKARLAIKPYLEDLVAQILHSFKSLGCVRLRLELPELTLEAGLLSVIGIIVNELLTNSVKYATQGRSCAEINLQARLERKDLVLEYRDDGPGIADLRPADRNNDYAHFGLNMIRSLVSQVHGSLRLFNDKGMACTLHLPLPKGD